MTNLSRKGGVVCCFPAVFNNHYYYYYYYYYCYNHHNHHHSLSIIIFSLLIPPFLCVSSEGLGAANQYLQHTVKHRANYTPALPEKGCADPQRGQYWASPLPTSGHSPARAPPVSPTGFGAAWLGSTGSACSRVCGAPGDAMRCPTAQVAAVLCQVTQILCWKCPLKPGVKHSRDVSSPASNTSPSRL